MKLLSLLFLALFFSSLTSFASNIEDQWTEVELWTSSSLLDKPESLFGHSFLRVKTKNNSRGFVIQFVAGPPAGEDISYSKGINGSYPIRIETKSATSYLFENIKASRGLKKLKLRLSNHEVHSLQLVYHWLTQQQSKLGNYYFFTKNCAQAILDYFALARIDIQKSLLRGKVPNLLADAFILSGRNQGPEITAFDLHESRQMALKFLNEPRQLAPQIKTNLILWFIADRKFIESKNILPKVYRSLPRYNSETIKEALNELLKD